ncbi:MAG: guanylate kinase, partial [Ginsengibacter sp.]
KSRLEQRGSETKESLEARVNKSAFEMTFKSYFKNVIINKTLDQACKEADAIVRSVMKNE